MYMQESREYIKTRMLKNIARAWGLPDTESENNFDPLVSMLLSACSIELEKISGEIESSRARILERMVQLLSPDAFTAALPAHAVATATPVDRKAVITEDLQFYITRKFQGTENDDIRWKDIFFTPTNDFTLSKATIRFMAIDNDLYRITNGNIKELVGHTDPGKELPACSLWLGIDEPENSLADCSFYFECRNEAHKQLFYQQLPKAKWYWNEYFITHAPGYGKRSICGEELDFKNILQREDDITGKIKHRVNTFYKTSFITITDEDNLTAGGGNELLSGMISDAFTGKPAQALKEYRMRWICIDFPQTINSAILKDISCMMNCFPVFNRRAHDSPYRMQEMVNVIPLQTEDIFLDLEEVTNDEGKTLSTRMFQKKEDEASGILVRNGGIGRFDERDAVALVDYLIQVLRDESAAFSALGNNFISAEMRQLQQTINKLEQGIFAADVHREQTPYLVIRNNPKRPWKNVFIRYWSTAGTDANQIKAGSALMQYRGSSFEGGRILLVNSTMGGQNKLGTNESVLAFKSAILSRDRLITEEDIKAFCHYQLGDRVKKIQINKGVQNSADVKGGFMKTIDVTISIKRNEFEKMEDNGETQFWRDNLRLLLEEKSVSLFPYRIFLNQAS